MKRMYKTLTVLMISVCTQAQVSEFSGISAGSEVCENANEITLSADNDITGSFSGEGVTDNGNGTATFNPSSAGSGTHDISYMVADRFTSLSLGNEYGLAVKDDGTLWTWGRNDYGQLGDGTLDNRPTPIQFGSDNDWIEVSASDFSSSMALKADGTIWTWGNNDPVPAQLGTDNDWAKIESGDRCYFGIKTDGTLWGIGSGSSGQLGTGGISTQHSVVQIGTDNDWELISSNDNTTYAIKTNGTLWAWGKNTNGQVGNGGGGNVTSPLQIGTDTNWETVDAGSDHVLAIKTDGTLWAWGLNNRGQVGDGTLEDRNVPVQIGTDTDWEFVSAGESASQALKTDGTRWVWGHNGNYAIHSEGVTMADNPHVPTQFDSNEWELVAMGWSNSAGLKTDGTLWTWGRNWNGAGGIGTSGGSIRYITPIFSDQTVKSIEVIAASASTDVRSSCGSLTWIDGNTYTESNNTATHVLQNIAGCDSVVTLDLTILESTSATDVVTGCGSYTWIDGIEYTENNNTATYVLTNAAGCDSLVTLNLTISENTVGTDVQTACNSFTWIDGNTYTESNNTATHILPSANGCDSLVTLDLTVSYTQTTTDVQTACDEFTWIDGNTYTESTNTPTYFYTSSAGCDSIVTLNLEIIEIDDEVIVENQTLTATESDADYLWFTCEGGLSPIAGATEQSFEATENGSYAVEISVNGCQMMSDCNLIETVSLTTIEETDFHVFPNPTNGKITLKLSDELLNSKIEVLNSMGQLVQTIFPNDKEIVAKLNGDPGVYFLRIHSLDKIMFTRIVKQ